MHRPRMPVLFRVYSRTLADSSGALAIFGCRSQDRSAVTTPNDTTASVDEMEVAAALQAFVVLLEDDDPRKRADIYTEDATFVMPGTALIQGRAEMLRRLEN